MPKIRLFVKQSESGLQWFVCNGFEDDFKIVWIEYREEEANDMKSCIDRMGIPCRKKT